MLRDVAEATRRKIIARARHLCEYCLYPDGRSAFAHQVDHIVSRKHGGVSTSDNLAYCCIYCNRYKGSDVAAIDLATGQAVRLFHPRLHLWKDHFRIQGGIIEPLTREGEVTARLLRFNYAERIVERTLLQNMGQYPRGSR